MPQPTDRLGRHSTVCAEPRVFSIALATSPRMEEQFTALRAHVMQHLWPRLCFGAMTTADVCRPMSCMRSPIR
jgi:hypothetical protein